MDDAMMTANDEIDELIGPCPRCAKFQKFPEKEAVEIMDLDREMRDNVAMSPLREILIGLPYYCRTCDTAMKFANQQSMREHNIKNLIYKTYSRGLIHKAAKECTFDKSNAELEKGNADGWEKARAFMGGDKTLWICGNPGVGKTWMARCILNQYLGEYRTAAEITGSAINDLDLFKSKGKIKKLIDVNILLIDDIDKPHWRDCGYAFLRDIIHGRYEDKKRVIITANTDPPRTRDMWFERAEVNHSVVMSIFDRLKPGQRIEMQGSSHR